MKKAAKNREILRLVSLGKARLIFTSFNATRDSLAKMYPQISDGLPLYLKVGNHAAKLIP